MEMGTPFARSEMCKPTNVAVLRTGNLQAAVAYFMISILVAAGRTWKLVLAAVKVDRVGFDVSSTEFTS